MCGGHFIQLMVPLANMPADQTAQLQDARNVTRQMHCPTCGSMITPEFSWCPKCGAALRPHPCNFCGQTVRLGENACSFCGAPAGKR